MEQFLYLFSGLRWQDILDISLNAYILFRFYVLFRGTNVIRILLGVCILWAVSRAAVPLGLIITNWAMQGVITIAAFIIIIIFRNEISSVLQTKDFKSFFWGIPQYQFHTPLDIIADSVYEMAAQKIGALIVLPLKKGLDNVVQGGVPVKGSLSKEMLISIFWPNTPLHDGAVVIQGNQITQAGVILPLSKRQDLPSSFGTRHRAAQGVTELTDALVIVVSEERGKISLFQDNHIYDVSDRSAFEKLLHAHASEGIAQKGFWRPKIELALVALVCFFCVTGVWMNFSKGMEALATYNVPVEFMMPDQNMEIISSSASDVELLISGTRPLLKSITAEQINVTLDLSQSNAGENRLPITNDNILLPPGIRLKNIEPSQLNVTLDTLMEKELPIQPHWTGKLPEGLVLKEAKAIPSMVRVSGGAMALSGISTLFTQALTLDTLSQSGSVETNLLLSPASLKVQSAESIRIQYVIVKKKDKI